MKIDNYQKYKKCFLEGNKGLFILTCIAVMISATIGVGTGYMLQKIMDVAVSGDVGELPSLLMFSGVFLSSMFAAGLLVRWSRNNFIQKAIRQYRETIFRDITQKDINSFISENSGDYISALTNDVAVIETNYLDATFDILQFAVLFIGALACMFWYSIPMTIVVVVMSFLPILTSVVSGKRLECLERKLSDKNGAFVNMVKDLLNGFTVVKSFKAEKPVMERYNVKNRDLVDSKYQREMAEELIIDLSEVTGGVVQIGVFLFGTYLSLKGSITPGVMLAFMQLMNFILRPIQNIPKLISQKKAAANLIRKAAEKVEQNIIDTRSIEKKNFSERIELQNVSFGYEPEKQILSDINIALEKGKSYALVGASGSGKSTLLKLIMGALQKYTGTVSIDGTDMQKIKRECVYDIFSVIEQNVFVFDSSISENICMFQEFDTAELDAAICKSGLSGLIAEKGKEYPCGENGSRLSGGEKQRISIARSLLRRASVLLVDEATTALDNATAYGVTNEILSIDDVTKIVITHKLDASILEKFDEIIVLRDGKVIESGAFTDLISDKGYFYSLYNVEGEAA